MALKKRKTNPKANPHIFLEFLNQPIYHCKDKTAIVVLVMIVGSTSDNELKRVARKAANYFLGENALLSKREQFRRSCLKQLRAIRKKDRKAVNAFLRKIRG